MAVFEHRTVRINAIRVYYTKYGNKGSILDVGCGEGVQSDDALHERNGHNKKWIDCYLSLWSKNADTHDHSLLQAILSGLQDIFSYPS